MTLTPKLPPGRANRKALAYTAEIQRLRAAGYSFQAIRQALRDVGVEVSLTTLKREAARKLATAWYLLQPHAHSRPDPEGLALPSRNVNETSPAPGSFAGDARTGKEIADEFMKDRITNPLMQERIRNEGRSA